MNLLQSWSNSLVLFKPAHLKLFLLVTLKSIIETYRLLFTRFWPLLLGWLIIKSVIPFNEVLQALVDFPMLFLLYLLIRPSMLKKDGEYIKGYGIHLLNDMLFGILYTLIIVICAFGVSTWLTMMAIQSMWAVIPFYYFFFLDSDGRFSQTIRSMARAYKMMFYALPFVAVIHLIQFAFLYGTSIMLAHQYIPGFLHVLYRMLLVICMPLMGCFWNNFYIKNLHDNFDLYFKRKEA